jgi:hypothetical protein
MQAATPTTDHHDTTPLAVVLPFERHRVHGEGEAAMARRRSMAAHPAAARHRSMAAHPVSARRRSMTAHPASGGPAT